MKSPTIFQTYALATFLFISIASVPAQAGFFDPCKNALRAFHEYFSPYDQTKTIARDWGTASVYATSSPGMVLSSHDQIKMAVALFERRANRDLADLDLRQSQGMSKGLSILDMYTAINAGSATERVHERIEEGLRKLEQQPLYGQSFDFDYDALGTAFFKTGLHISKVGDLYIVSFSESYVGNLPTFTLAKKMNAPMAVSNVRVRVPVKQTDGIAKIDLSQALGKVFSQRVIRSIAKNSVANTSNSRRSSIRKFTTVKLANASVRITAEIRQNEYYNDTQPNVLSEKTVLSAKAHPVSSENQEPFLEITLSDENGVPYVSSQELSQINEALDLLIHTLNAEQP